jgi:hypothetical protein
MYYSPTTLAVSGALGVAAWSKFIAKHDARVSLLYFVALFLILLLTFTIFPVKKRDERV